ncbi:MAG TPA: hypothetical protein VMR81_06715 [Patescibacteria group bacterium]|jgi:hypothetical protein|nr:hypothetical protein [Patescibacteria group bacterium]
MKYLPIAFGIVLLFISLFRVPQVFATTCAEVDSGDQTISSSCTFAGTGSYGVDTGSGTSNTATLNITGGTLTVNCNQAIGFGKVVVNGGSVAIASGCGATPAKLVPGGSVWMVDGDGDHYPATTTQTVSATSPGASYKRRNTITSTTLTDCDDTDANVHPGQTAYFTTISNGGIWDYDCSGGITYHVNLCTCGACISNGCGSSLSCPDTYPTVGYTCGVTYANGASSCTANLDIYLNCTSCSPAASSNVLPGCH